LLRENGIADNKLSEITPENLADLYQLLQENHPTKFLMLTQQDSPEKANCIELINDAIDDLLSQQTQLRCC